MPLEPIPMTAPLTIRPATIDDTDLILHFVRELAIYEKAEHEVLATPPARACGPCPAALSSRATPCGSPACASWPRKPPCR